MTHSVKIGVVGASWFTDLWYLPVLQKHQNVIIQAICSKTGESAMRMAEKYEIPMVYTDYKEMFMNEELDGVCIVTPNDSHKQIALAAIEKGIHVICEKPLALHANEALELVKAVNNTSLIHAINFTYREHPAVREMKSLVEQGVIGSVHEARFEYSGDYGLNGPPGWRGTISKGGIGGILQDLGSHLIDLGKYILNDNIDKVQGFLSFYENGKLKSYHEKSTKDQAADSVSFLAQFSNGIRATFSTSWIANQGNKKQTIDIQLYGTKGSIKLVTCELGTSLRYANKGENWHAVKVEGLYQLNLESEPHEYKFRPWRLTKTNEVWKWIDHIRNRKTNELATFYDGLSVQKVIDAVIESAKQERLIDIK